MPFNESGQATGIRTTVFIRARAGGHFDVPSAADRIAAEFPGARITAADSFEAERERYRRAAAAAHQQGLPTEGIPLVRESIDSKQAATGPGVDLCLPVADHGEIAGSVRGQSFRFHTELAPSHPAVERLVALLESLAGDAVQVIEHP